MNTALNTVVAFPVQPNHRRAKRVPTPQSPVVEIETIRSMENVQMRVPTRSRKSADPLIEHPRFRRGNLTVEFVSENRFFGKFLAGALYTGAAELQLQTCQDGTVGTVLVFKVCCVPDPVCTLCVATAKKGDKNAVAGAVISLKLIPPTI